MTQMGSLEKAVMDCLWRSQEPTTAKAVVDELEASGYQDAGRTLAVTTVLTVLSRLEAKGMAVRSREHRPHRYSPTRTREEHTAELMADVLSSAPDREAVLARFIGTVSAEEARTLQKLLGSP